MQKETPLSNIQLNSFSDIYKLISEKTSRVIQNANKWAKIQLQVNKKSVGDGVFICYQCGAQFKRVHQRSAHMNKHANDRKKEAKKRQVEANEHKKEYAFPPTQKRRLIRKDQKTEKEKKLRGRKPKRPTDIKITIEKIEEVQQFYEQKESFDDYLAK